MASIPKTQTAVVFDKHNGPLNVVKDHPVVQAKDLKANEALVNVKFSGVCHTDLHAHKGDWPLATKLPLVGGHEGAGHIVAIGAGTDTSLKVGDAVGIKWLAYSCLDCGFCRKGQESLCQKQQNAGYSVDGSFQQYAVAFVNHLTPIPNGLDLAKAAPILCAGVTVYSALKKTNTQPGDTVLISGAGGGLGHLALQYAVAMGLRVIAVDTGDKKKAACLHHGAEAWVDFKETKDIVQSVKDAAEGLGPHACVIASASGAAYTQALEYIRPGGTLVCVGMPPEAVIQANVFWTVVKGVRIQGSIVGNRQEAVEALDFAVRGKVDADIAVEPLANLEDVYKRMEDGKLVGRIVLQC